MDAGDASAMVVDRILKERKYKNKSNTGVDVLNVLAGYENLHPKELISRTTKTGKDKLVLCLAGTFPIVKMEGFVVDVPVIIQIFPQYPQIPPNVLIVPTENSILVPSVHVDGDGKVYLPLLNQWKDAKPKPDLIQLVGMMQKVFSVTPPVCPKPTHKITSSPTITNFFSRVSASEFPIEYPPVEANSRVSASEFPIEYPPVQANWPFSTKAANQFPSVYPSTSLPSGIPFHPSTMAATNMVGQGVDRRMRSTSGVTVGGEAAGVTRTKSSLQSDTIPLRPEAQANSTPGTLSHRSSTDTNSISMLPGMKDIVPKPPLRPPKTVAKRVTIQKGEGIISSKPLQRPHVSGVASNGSLTSLEDKVDAMFDQLAIDRSSASPKLVDNHRSSPSELEEIARPDF